MLKLKNPMRLCTEGNCNIVLYSTRFESKCPGCDQIGSKAKKLRMKLKF